MIYMENSLSIWINIICLSEVSYLVLFMYVKHLTFNLSKTKSLNNFILLYSSLNFNNNFILKYVDNSYLSFNDCFSVSHSTHFFFLDKFFWSQGFKMTEDKTAVPLFLGHLANEIFTCGKTINLLKLTNIHVIEKEILFYL